MKIETPNFPFYAFWREWFAQPEELKLERSRKSGKGGFYPLGSESPGYSGKPDPKEYYHWRLKEGDFGGTETSRLFWECYEKASKWLMDRGLGVVRTYVKPEECVLRVLHYLPTPDGMAGEAHEDFDLLTVNVPGTCPGLEVQTPCDGGGCGDPCPECGAEYAGCAFECSGKRRRDCVCEGSWQGHEANDVHVGEMLDIYTRWRAGFGQGKTERATIHRVRTPPNTERFKAVFFYLPPMDFVLRPEFTAHDYLLGPNGVLVKAGTSSQVKVAR